MEVDIDSSYIHYFCGKADAYTLIRSNATVTTSPTGLTSTTGYCVRQRSPSDSGERGAGTRKLV